MSGPAAQHVPLGREEMTALLARVLAPTPSALRSVSGPKRLEVRRRGLMLSVRFGEESGDVRCPSVPIARAMERGFAFWMQAGPPWAPGLEWPSLAALHAHVDHDLECARIVADRRRGRRAA